MKPAMDKAVGLLGLMMRAGQMKTGESQSLLAVRNGEAVAVLLDAEVSQNTRKRFTDACTFRKIPYFDLPPDVLADSIGKPGRKVAALTRGSLAEQLMKLLSQIE